MADLPDLDDVALTHLRGDPGMLAALAAFDVAADGIRGDGPRPPYPMIVVTSTAAGRFGRWVARPELLVEVWGDPDGRPGKKALYGLLVTALRVLRMLPDRDFGPGEAVVTFVSDDAAGGWLPDPGGQPRWVAAVPVAGHPPTTP